MKPNREEREKLVGLIRRGRAKFPLSNAELAAIAKVDPGQTSRILNGQFRTVSGNVLRICSALGVDPHCLDEDPSPKGVRKRAAWAKLEASIRRAWDQTPQGADLLVAVIDAVAKVKPARRLKGIDPDAPPVSNPATKRNLVQSRNQDV
jgi:DNA-binding Xre family transcriptional regulator